MRDLPTNGGLRSRFELIRPIRRDELIEVLEGRDVSSGKAVLVKRHIRGSLHERPGDGSPLELEFRILSHLRHPALPRVIDFFPRGSESCYLILGDEDRCLQLQDWAERGPSLESCLAWWSSLLSALDYLHAVGVRHGSVSPSALAADVDEGTRSAEARLMDLHRASWRVFPAARAGTPRQTLVDPVAAGRPGVEYRADVQGAVATMSWLLTTALLGESAPLAAPAANLVRVRDVIPGTLFRALNVMLTGDDFSRPRTIGDVRMVLSSEGVTAIQPPALEIREASARGLIPRRQASQLIRSLLDGLRDRPGRLVVLVGAAGSGKTTIGCLCENEARAYGVHHVVWTERVPGSSHLRLKEPPVQPRGGDASRPSRIRDSRVADRGTIADRPPMTDEQPTLCFVDDADRLSRDDLVRLLRTVRSVKSSGLAWSAVATCAELPLPLLEGQSCAVEGDNSAGAAAADAQAVVELHNLGGMAVDEVRALLGDMMCRPAGQELAEWMTTKTAGNPLFLSELVNAVCRRGGLTDGPNGVTLVPDASEAMDVPETIANVLFEEAMALGDDEKQVARVISLGPGVNLQVAEAATGLSQTSVHRAVNALSARGILRVENGEMDLAFSHDLLRDTVYEHIPEPVRAALHNRVAAFMSDSPDGGGSSAERNGALAWHLYRSASPREALAPALIAVSEFEKSGSSERVLDYLRIVEQLTLDSHVGEETLRCVSDAYWRLGRASDCARVLTRLLRALETERATPADEIIQVECALGRALTLGGDADSALAVFERALRLARQQRDPVWTARVSNGRAAVHQMKGEFASIDAIADENIALLEGRTDYEALSASYNVKGNAQSALCNWRSAVAWYDKSAECSLQAGMPQLARAAMCNKGLALMYLGAWDQSESCFERVAALTRAEMDPYATEMLNLNRGSLLQRRGALSSASEAFRAAVDAARECGDKWGHALALSNIGELEWVCGDPCAALVMYDRSEELMAQAGSRDDLPELLRRRALAQLSLGKMESASELVDRASTLAQAMGTRLELANCMRVNAAILLRAGVPGGMRYLEDAVALTRQLGAPYEFALSLAELATAQADAGAPEEAVPGLGEALQVLLDLGARRDARSVQEALARTAGRLPSRTAHLPSDRARLTSLYGASRSLATAESIQDLLKEMADIAASIVPAKVVASVLTVTGSTPVSAVSEMTGEMRQHEAAIREVTAILMADCPSASAFTVNLQDVPPALQGVMSEAGAERVLLVPIVSPGRKLGAVYLGNRRRDDRFSEQDVRFLEALAAQAAVALENALLRASLQDEVQYLRWEIDGRSSFSNIIGQSLEMQKLFTLLHKVSRTSVTVLIEGESGTGKELVARAIHHNGPRRAGRFLAQNCAALPEQLLESELFGHVRGAFTGAMREKPGLFEAADGGTFFLDEIADMPPSLQVKLLRVLQDGEIRRVGATDSQSVDVRIIAATNRTLEDEVRAGRFREDLFYRLNVVKITMPPLRDRRDDIPLLAQHFLDTFSKDMGDRPRGFSDTAMELLVNYDWPGNVRELENEVQRALALANPGAGITPSVLSERIRSVRVVVHPPRPGTTLSLKDMVTDVERRVILQVLMENGWNKSRTAELLGLSRQGLLKKIARFGLTRDDDA